MPEIEEKDHTDQPVPVARNWMHLLNAGLILLVCTAFFQASQIENLLTKISASQREGAALRTKLTQSDDELRKALTRFHGELGGLRDELISARELADQSLEKAQQATTYADTLAGRLERKRREQEKQQKQLSAELNQVRESTDQASNLLNGISDAVGDVRSTIESVKADTTRNNAELKTARTDVGFISGRIATNSQEIQRLRELGDRSVYEFTLTKTGMAQRVGDIELKLNKTDEKRNSFNVEILADDKWIERRDKTINEPVQFLVPSKADQAYELVVNQVTKNTVKGYLAAPKVTVARY